MGDGMRGEDRKEEESKRGRGGIQKGGVGGITDYRGREAGAAGRRATQSNLNGAMIEYS